MTKFNTQAIKADNRLVLDMSNEISWLDSQAAPFTAIMTKVGKSKANSTEINWLERTNEAKFDKVVAAADAAVTALTVETGAAFKPDTLIKVASTGENILVKTVAGNTLTVIRGFGKTPAAPIAADDVVVIISNVSAEGSGAPVEGGGVIKKVSNYTQILKNSCQVTNTSNVVKIYGTGTLLTQEQKAMMLQHKLDLEKVLLFGEAKEDLTGANPVRTAGGVLSFLTQNVMDVSGDGILTEDEFNFFLEDVFKHGSSKKTLFASPRLISVINSWGVNKLQEVSGANKTYGLSIHKYISGHGELLVVPHKMLVGPYSGYGIVLDISNVKYKPLRDTKLTANTQANDMDIRQDVVLTEMTLELRQAETHALIKGVVKGQ